MRIRFFTHAPAPEKLLAALRGCGHVVEIGETASFNELPDDASTLIDESALPHFAHLAGRLHDRRAAALVRDPQMVPQDLLPALHRFIATSVPCADQLADTCGVEPARIRVIAPGVDAAPRSSGTDGRGCNLLMVGPFAAGGALLLQALARLFDLDWTLTIVAAAEKAPDELAASLGIAARVHRADPRDLETVWRTADLLVLPAPWDGAPPCAIAAALRRGVPVVVTAAGPAASVVPAQAGLVCPPEDRDQLSRALRRLIFDPALRRAYADTAFAAGAALPDWPTQAALLAEALA